MSTIEIEVPHLHGYIYNIYVRNMRGTLLRESAMYCVGITEYSGIHNDLPHSQTPYLNVEFR